MAQKPAGWQATPEGSRRDRQTPRTWPARGTEESWRLFLAICRGRWPRTQHRTNTQSRRRSDLRGTRLGRRRTSRRWYCGQGKPPTTSRESLERKPCRSLLLTSSLRLGCYWLWVPAWSPLWALSKDQCGQANRGCGITRCGGVCTWVTMRDQSLAPVIRPVRLQGRRQTIWITSAAMNLSWAVGVAHARSHPRPVRSRTFHPCELFELIQFNNIHPDVVKGWSRLYVGFAPQGHPGGWRISLEWGEADLSVLNLLSLVSIRAACDSERCPGGQTDTSNTVVARFRDPVTLEKKKNSTLSPPPSSSSPTPRPLRPLWGPTQWRERRGTKYNLQIFLKHASHPVHANLSTQKHLPSSIYSFSDPFLLPSYLLLFVICETKTFFLFYFCSSLSKYHAVLHHEISFYWPVDFELWNRSTRETRAVLRSMIWPDVCITHNRQKPSYIIPVSVVNHDS